MRRSVWIGWDPQPKEVAAFSVARYTLKNFLSSPLQMRGLVLRDLQRAGLYTRPFEWRRSAADRPVMWDLVSDAAQSTEHANARFLVPTVAVDGWALFTDADVMFRNNIHRVFDKLDPTYAVYCVHHDYQPDAASKMEGQVQTQYNRKNWSSVCFFNCDHPANKKLTVEYMNSTPGRDLHRFCWLEDHLIGKLDPGMNFLVGHHSQKDIPDPTVVHFTEGTPNMVGYENCDFADEWRGNLEAWAR